MGARQASEILENLLILDLRATVGRILRPKFQQMAVSSYYGLRSGPRYHQKSLPFLMILPAMCMTSRPLQPALLQRCKGFSCHCEGSSAVVESQWASSPQPCNLDGQAYLLRGGDLASAYAQHRLIGSHTLAPVLEVGGHRLQLERASTVKSPLCSPMGERFGGQTCSGEATLPVPMAQTGS